MWIDDTYRVVLFGHRDFCENRILDKTLYPLLQNLIRTNPFVEIYIGRNGEFDVYAATVIKRVQNAMGKERTEFICVLPYTTIVLYCPKATKKFIQRMLSQGETVGW